ncbi:hypothetical protein SAMN02799616_01364 [Paenibacillus sp. UNC499MF]|nr:hypothetical protein SAMN02799616_01364 [Paenibacillus sp. UNC499MF]
MFAHVNKKSPLSGDRGDNFQNHEVKRTSVGRPFRFRAILSSKDIVLQTGRQVS